MIEKEYWFAFEPYVHINRKRDAALIYNTLDAKYIYVREQEILLFLDDILEKKNNGVVKVKNADLGKKYLLDFIKKVREFYLGDLYDCTVSQGKPIQFYPIMNLQDDVNRIKRLDAKHIGDKMYSYLYQLTIDVGELIDKSLYSFLDKIYTQTRYSNLREFCIIPHNSIQIGQIQDWAKDKEKSFGHFVWILNTKLASIFTNILKESIFVVIEDIKDEWNEINVHKVKWIIKITSEVELKFITEWIDKNQIENYNIRPVYNGKNLDFFEKHVFMDEEDILAKPISMQSIMRNQVLNVNDFGKLHINAEGYVFTNKLFPAIGNIHSSSLRLLIHKEMTEGQAWLRTRSKEPCSECVFQWLCPSLSEHEILIGKEDLCRLKNIQKK